MKMVTTYKTKRGKPEICLVEWGGDYFLGYFELPCGSWTIDEYNDWLSSWTDVLPLSVDIPPQTLPFSEMNIDCFVSSLVEMYSEDEDVNPENVKCSFYEIYTACFKTEDPRRELREYIKKKVQEAKEK